MTSGDAGFCSQALIRSNPPATAPTANTATTIHTAEDIEQLSAYDWSFASGYARPVLADRAVGGRRARGRLIGRRLVQLEIVAFGVCEGGDSAPGVVADVADERHTFTLQPRDLIVETAVWLE